MSINFPNSPCSSRKGATKTSDSSAIGELLLHGATKQKFGHERKAVWSKIPKGHYFTARGGISAHFANWKVGNRRLDRAQDTAVFPEALVRFFGNCSLGTFCKLNKLIRNTQDITNTQETRNKKHTRKKAKAT
jgi:hypothetical protein